MHPSACYDPYVDLTRTGTDEGVSATPAKKLAQALEMMRAGFRIKLAALHVRFPDASEAEIAAKFSRWLARDE